MTRVIAFVNQKGGVAKTTSTINIGAGLADKGHTVLLVDLDPQGSMTASLGIRADELDHTMYEILTKDQTLNKAIVNTGFYDLVPSDIRLSGAEIELSTIPGREMLLKEALQTVTDTYDYILIDCPPSLGLLTLNALTAASEIFVPLQTEYLALHGMSQLIRTVDTVKTRLNDQLDITGIIATFHDDRKKLNQEVLQSVKNHFEDKVFNTHIRNNIALAEAASYGEDIFKYKPDSNGATDYRALVDEIIERGQR